MKDNKLFLKIYVLLLIIFSIAIIVLSILGKKTRVGYLGEFKFDDFHINRTLELNNLSIIKDKFINSEGKLDEESIKNYIFTNQNITNYSYGFKVQYYDKVFRHSDIYNVYIDTNKLLNDNKFIKEIDINNGSPFGNLISSKKIEFDKIDNVNYKLKIRSIFIIYFISFILLFIIIKYYNLIILNNKIYYLMIIIALLFSIFIRIYWADKQDMMHWDEYYSVISSNHSEYYNKCDKYNNVIGYDIIKDFAFNDKTFKDFLLDVKELHKNSNDSFIANIYYILLRTAFLGREVYDIKNIIITGTILNCIFHIISFIFLYKFFELIFDKNKEIILPLVFIFSLSEMSVSFSMFLRPYQMQETFYIVITFIVLNTIYNNNYSIKNFIITTFVASIGYLILYSSMLFVLILSVMLFINYCISYINKKNFNFIKPLLKIDSYKTILYYAGSFISALFLSQLLYPKFFNSLLNSGNRAGSSFKLPINLLSYLDKLVFCDILLIVLILLVIMLLLLKLKITKNIIVNDKYNLMIFIIVLALINSIISDVIGPYSVARYSGSSYIFILFVIPIIVSLIQNYKIRNIVLIFFSIIYILNMTFNIRFDSFDNYFEQSDKDLYVFEDNANVYLYDKMLALENINYINTNAYYTVITNESDFSNYIHEDSFYFVINTNYNLIYSDSFLTNYNIDYKNSIYEARIYYLTKNEIY